MISVRQSAMVVGGFGALTTLLLAVGANSVGGVLALVQLGFLVGMPLAIVLHHELRSWPVVMVLAIALSLALSAIAVQFLVWFRVANSELLVMSATAYGVVLAMLLSSADFGRDGPVTRRPSSSDLDLDAFRADNSAVLDADDPAVLDADDSAATDGATGVAADERNDGS